jgi:hypothetical protein
MSRTLGERKNPSGIGKETAEEEEDNSNGSYTIELRACCGVGEHWVLGK